MNSKEKSLFEANTLNLHYWFKDNSHTMDAIIQNKCEFELLAIINEVAIAFDAKIIIETEPLANGGLKRYFKIILKNEKKSAVITTAIITALIATILATPITTSITKITEKLIEKIFEDEELDELKKEKLKLEVVKLRQETAKNDELLKENNKIKKRKSNFYETLEKYPKVEKISIIIESDDKKPLSEEMFVLRKDFSEFILISDDLESDIVDNAIIEIISPVLKKGKYKWTGIYGGEAISFNMKSNEFKTLVQTGKVEFRNGSSIACNMEIRKKIDNEGVEKIVGYDIIRVNHYFENDNPVETQEGKRHRRQKEANQQQLSFFAPPESN